jgi:serine/threonine-protein kinase
MEGDGFVWCQHCTGPHPTEAKFCPRTGKAMSQKAGHGTAKPERIGAGTIIDKKYYIVALIGRGGYSIVYEALHTTLGQRVALKFMEKEQDRKALDRFEQEARVAASIAHPNVCRSYDMGKLSSGTRYIVMERLYGESLYELVQRQRVLDPTFIVSIMTQVLAALGVAHKAGVIHRDIKPGNVFVERPAGFEAVAKVLDFGLAKMVGGPSAIRTTIGRALGTPAYMSPEQITGKGLDGRSDLWAVGVVLYEALSGRRPFNASTTPELCASILRDDPPPLTALRPGLSPALAGIVHRALEKNRADRFTTASEFRRSLQRLTRIETPVPSTARRPLLPSLAQEDDSSSSMPSE